MKYIKTLLLTLSVVLVGCSEKKNVETHFLPFMKGCEDYVNWLNTYLKEKGAEPLTRVIMVTDYLKPQRNWGSIVEVNIKPGIDGVQLGIDTYLMRCGPNTTISFSDLPNEKEIRKRINRSKSTQYTGPLKSGFDENGKMEFYFYEALD